MNLQRIFTIIGKEVQQTYRNLSVWAVMLIPQAALTGLLLYILHALTIASGRMSDGKLPAWVMDYFVMFFAGMSTHSAAMMAAACIMGDKASRSLEPLLATPLTPFEFIFGKLLVAVLPPVCSAAIAFKIFTYKAGTWGVVSSRQFENLGGLACFGTITVISLLLTSFAALNGFLVATRKTEGRSATLSSASAAQGMSLLPMAGVYYGFKHNIPGTTWAVEAIVILLLANFVLFGLGLAKFQRETILFKWK